MKMTQSGNTVRILSPGRITMDTTATTRIIVLCIGSAAMSGLGQSTSQAPPPAVPTAPPAPSRYAGCVQRSATDKDTIILSNETLCAKLTGTVSVEKLVGHEVDLKGVLTDRTTSVPAAIRVMTINSVGKSCADVCSLLPPHGRPLKKGDYPGKEGGTPGAAPTKPPQ
jgi:hypothetical protein